MEFKYYIFLLYISNSLAYLDFFWGGAPLIVTVTTPSASCGGSERLGPRGPLSWTLIVSFPGSTKTGGGGEGENFNTGAPEMSPYELNLEMLLKVVI